MTPEQINTLRTAYGTQADAADALGVSLRYVHGMEAERDTPHRHATLYAYALRGLLAEAGKPDPLAEH